MQHLVAVVLYAARRLGAQQPGDNGDDGEEIQQSNSDDGDQSPVWRAGNVQQRLRSGPACAAENGQTRPDKEHLSK